MVSYLPSFQLKITAYQLVWFGVGWCVCANWEIDQQIGQLYELMQAIQNKDGEGEGEGEKQ